MSNKDALFKPYPRRSWGANKPNGLGRNDGAHNQSNGVVGLQKKNERIIAEYATQAGKKIRELSGPIVMLDIMERFKWTYQEYIDCPPWIIDLIYQKDAIDAK